MWQGTNGQVQCTYVVHLLVEATYVLLNAHTVYTCMDAHKQTHCYSFIREPTSAQQIYSSHPHSGILAWTATPLWITDTDNNCHTLLWQPSTLHPQGSSCICLMPHIKNTITTLSGVVVAWESKQKIAKAMGWPDHFQGSGEKSDTPLTNNTAWLIANWLTDFLIWHCACVHVITGHLEE